VGLMNVSRWPSAKRLALLFFVMIFVLAGCSLEAGPLNPKGPVGEGQLELIKLSLFIMIFVLIVVFAIFFYVLFRFRQRKGQNHIPEQVEGSHKLELIWTVIPLLLLFILAVPTVAQTFKLAQDYSEYEEAVKVRVIAHQFWWEFEYPELGIRTAQDLWIPTGKVVQFELMSTDVLHSFWIPALGGKTDTNPGGIVNKMYLQADEPGIYKGKCAELCGASHALMDFKAIAVSEAEFNAWVADMTEPVTVAEEFQAGEEIFAAKCLQCHAITPNGPGFGPNLNNFADRELVAGFRPNDTEWLTKWIVNPQDVKEGNMMPAFGMEFAPEGQGLTDEEIDAVVKYLQQLK
jgi:cytochrome c oxidase subunit 2